MGSYIYLSDGTHFHFDDPGPFCVEDVALSLSRQARYTGHGAFVISVAQHCCNCVYLAKQLGIWKPYDLLCILMHDAAEAYLGDVSSPLKARLREYQALEAYIEEAMYDAFGLNDHERRHEVDQLCSKAEKESVVRSRRINRPFIQERTTLAEG